MKIGTKTLLFGVHQVALHPWFVLAAWVKLYGVPPVSKWIPLLVACIIHDWGYWGKNDLDGAEGDTHSLLGSQLMEKMFGVEWADFCLYHTRFYAKKDNRRVSQLAAADKYSIGLMPDWLYIPLGTISGEIDEYMEVASTAQSKYQKVGHVVAKDATKREWLHKTKAHMVGWAIKNAQQKDYDPMP